MSQSRYFEVLGHFDIIINSNQNSHFDYKYFKSIFNDNLGIFQFRKDLLNPFTKRFTDLPDDIILGFYISDIGNVSSDFDWFNSHNVIKDKSDFFVLNRITDELKEEIINAFIKYYDSEIYFEIDSKISEIKDKFYQISRGVN